MTKRKNISYRSDKCLNCNTSLDVSEKYCHFCGQLNSTKKLTILDFLEEFFANFYAYDSKIRNTFLFLFSKPGFVAKQIVEGKRQTFANPFRLFLSISLLLFISYNLNNTFDFNENNTLTNEANNLNDQLKEQDSISKNIAGEKSVFSVMDQLGLNQDFHADSIYTKSELSENFLGNTYYRITSFRNYHKKDPKTKTPDALINLGYENTRVNQFIFNKAQHFKSNNIDKEITNYVIAKLPFLIFLALPMLTVIFWLVFYDKKYNYAEVLVFTYTFYTFVFISLLLLELVSYLNEGLSTTLQILCFVLIFPIYLYKSLRYFYETSRWKTIFKFVLLNILFLPAMLITSFFVISLALILF
ncbi:DUF3667 domain-containing protein [Flavobacterium sp.]|jgi:hypothetical protein|uniref:DUF3667 domain-containing protein n=1 Tax=Flavobacterium sp. TaxID=239 RepID=UPI002A81E1EE|nr:DUF3667 domain-containing protein [Flavobacterium sp.]